MAIIFMTRVVWKGNTKMSAKIGSKDLNLTDLIQYLAQWRVLLPDSGARKNGKLTGYLIK